MKPSLVDDINKRKRDGKSRPKARSHVSKDSYAEMEAGWPHSKKVKKAKRAHTAKKTAKKKSAKKTVKRRA